MKYPIILLAIAIASCNKSALLPQQYQTIHQKWIVQEGHDQAAWSAAQFCVASDYLNVDTIELYYTTQPDDPNKFGYEPGTIYFHVPGGRVPTEIPDIYDRYYCRLLALTQ